MDTYVAGLPYDYRCVDCKVDTLSIGEFYTVSNYIWWKYGVRKKYKMLCIGCLESRMGRRLVSDDFPYYPINTPSLSNKSVRLVIRISDKRKAH